MVRMAQDWNMRYPLVDGHGNYGSIDGDGAAAMRYTEARMTKLAQELLTNLKKDVVPKQLNYSDDEYEPMVLPAYFPNLLVNGGSGIAVGMACSFASHNMNEVIDGVVAYIKNNDISIDGLMEHIKGPDFPTGGIVINQEDIKSIYETGRGSVKIRGKYTKEKQSLVFTEIPYNVCKEELIANIAHLCDEKKIEGITDIQDESNAEGMRIVIKLKKDIHADVMANKLFALTRLQDNFSYNQVCLIDSKTPKLLTLREIIVHYVEHLLGVMRKGYEYDLVKINASLHLLEGLLIALEDIDNVLALIKKSPNVTQAIDGLKEKYNLSDIQAKAIVDMKLRKLTGLEKIELQNEHNELVAEKDRIEKILANTELLNAEAINSLNSIKQRFGDKRRTELTNIKIAKEDKDIEYVMPEDMVVVLTQNFEIKKIPAKSYKVQNRNGKGVKNQNELAFNVLKTNTTDTMMVFTSLGRVYKILVDNIPNGTNASKGVSIYTLAKIDTHDKIMAITSLQRKSTADYVVMFTEQGMVKKTLLSEYIGAGKKMSAGANAIKLKEDDSIASVTFLNEEQVILLTEKGMSIRFATDTINPVGKTAMGIRGMNVSEGDKVIAVLPVNKMTDEVALFAKCGLGKRSKITDFPLQGRGGKGTIAYRGELAGASMVDNSDNILVVGDQTSILISASDIPALGKTATGNVMIKDNVIRKVIKIKQ